MGRWLDAARQKEKNAETLLRRTDETDITTGNEVLSVLAVPPRAISAKFFSNETQRDVGGDCIETERLISGRPDIITLWTEATKGRQGQRTDLVDNVHDVERPSGNSATAGLRSLQKAAASEDAQPICREKNTETAISLTAKTDKTSSVGFGSSSQPHFHDFFLPDPVGVWTEADWQDAFEERAAILEYDGGWHRDAAESLARQYIDEQKALRKERV